MGEQDGQLASLRTILLGPEHQRLLRMQARLEDPDTRAEDIGEVLPQVLMQHAHDPHFTRALTPPLEKAITASVQRNPKPLADALFPVMGPAIRKAVSAGLAGMVESLNRTLENSLSFRSFQWRIEAMRTGKSFAEVVLVKTLLYRVEQVFLIERTTGLLLQHVRAGGDDVQDADMVSGMLSAIRSFVQDSFKVAESDSLEALKVGDLSVWIEPGPHAIIAAVIRGSAPREFRRTLQDALEMIHLGFGEVLESSKGDASALDDARPALEACLQAQYHAAERKPRTRGAWIVFGLAAAALLVWAGFSYRAHARWNRYLAALKSEPGLVVVSSGREDGKFVVSGLRDPLARDPSALLPQSGLANDDVVARWAPYEALEPSLILARARRTLQPPEGTTLTLRGGVLSATGSVPLAWVAEARRVAPFLAGVTSFDAVGALDGTLRPVISGIESTVLLFIKGSPRLTPGQDEAFHRIAAGVRQLEACAAAAGTRFKLDITGHTDADGAPELNLPLSVARAESVKAALAAEPMPQIEITAAGVGSSAPVVASDNEDDKQRNRRVAIRVTRVR